MAKKITFLLIIMFVLLLASVTAFAAGSESTTPEAFAKANFVNVSSLEKEYGDVFFGKDHTGKKIITVNYERAYSVVKSLRHTFTGSVIDTSADMDNPVIMLMYIKVNGRYVPLKDVDTGENINEGLIVTNSMVDLKYLGSNKVNEVRIIAFRKNSVENLTLNENLQITDLDITVRPWSFIEKIKITYNEVKNNLTTP